MKRLRVLLADDHRMFLAGLRRLLEPTFEVVDTVEDGRALIAAAAKWNPDVIVTDISMPLLNGVEAARALVAAGCRAQLIFLTMHGDALYVKQAMNAGASDYVLKRDAPDKLLAAIHKAGRRRRQHSSAPSEPQLPKSNFRNAQLGEITPRHRGLDVPEHGHAFLARARGGRAPGARLKHGRRPRRSAERSPCSIGMATHSI